MSLVMDFLHPVEDIGKGIVQGFTNPAAKFGNTILDLGDMTDALVGAATGNQQASINAQEAGNRRTAPGGGLLHQGGVVQNNQLNGPLTGKQIEAAAGTGVELGTYATGAGAAGEAAAEKAPSLAMDFIHGAATGAVANATYQAGSEMANNQPISPGQIAKSAAIGGIAGGALGAGIPAAANAVRNAPPLNEVGAVGANVSDQFNDEDLQKMAESNDPKQVEKTLEPVTGPVVAKEIAPAVAKSTDPNVAKNIIDQSVNQKVPPALSNATQTGQAPLSNQDFINEFNSHRANYGDDDKFYNEFVTQAADMPNKAGDLAQEIIGQHELDNIPVKDALDNSLNPDTTARTPFDDYYDARNELAGIASRNNQPQLLKQFDEQTKGMSVQDKTSYLNNALTNYRNKGGMLAESMGATPDTTGANPQSPAPPAIPPPTPTSDINTPTQVAGEASNEINTFMNAPGETGPTAVTKAGTMQEMQDMINSGQYSNDEVMGHYFNQQPNADLGEAQDALDQVINSAGIDKSKINASENPQFGKSSFAPVAEGDDTAAQLNGRYAGTKVGEVGAPAYQTMEALDAHDREFTRYLRGKDPLQVQDIIKQANDPETFEKFVDANKTYSDFAQAQGAELGQPLPYRVNYGTRTPYEPPEGFGEGPEGTPTPGATNPETPAYTQARYFNTHEEALANGYTPKNEDPLEDLRSDINQRAYNQTQLALAKGYEQAHPGEVKMLNDSTPVPSGYRQLIVPGGEHIALPTDIAEKINDRIMTKAPGKVLGAYDTINQAGKALELGGGTFHGFNTAGTFVGQQLLSGKAFTDMPATAKVVSNFFSDSHMQSYLDDAAKEPSGGVDEGHSLIDGANASGLNIKNTSVDITNPGEKSLASKVIGIPGLKQIHEAVFERQIPTMMLETFRQKTQGLDIFGSPEDRAEAENIARGINKEFGVTDHDLAGMTSQQFKVAGRFMLAPGYQEGVVHTLLTALDPRSIGTAEGHLAREAVFGKALLFGGLATAGAAAGGDFKGQTPKQIALGILNKAVNPSFDIGGYKVETPATNISDVAKPIEESVEGEKAGKGGLTGLEDFASSHLAFAPAKAEEVVGNKNYEGNPIYGTDYYGRPISGKTTAENLASGILPIPLAQGEAQATGQQNTAATVANTIGFNVAPTGNTQYAPIYMQTYLQSLQATPGVPKAQIDADTKFAEALSQGDSGRAKILKKATGYLAQAEKSTSASQAASLQQKATKAIDAFNKQLVAALQPWAQGGGTKYLDGTMLEILRQTMVTYKSANENVNYDIKTNPTAYGVPIGAIASGTVQTNS